MAKIKKTKTHQHKIKKPAKEATAEVLKELAKSKGLLSAIGDSISILDRTFKILYQNEAEKDMMGDHVGEKCYKAYAKRKSICSGCPVAITFKDGKVHTVQRELQTDEGKRYAEITASPIKNSSGKIIAGIEVVRDTTDRWTATLRLKESEKLFSSVLQALDGLLVVLNRDLQIIYSNWKGHDFVPEEKKQGNPYCYKVFKHLASPCDDCPPLKTFVDGKSRTYEDKNPIDGSFKEIYVSPVTDDTGNVLFVIEYVRDITDRTRVEKEIHNKVKELEEFYDIAIGRELRMKELKERIGKLEKELSKYKKYGVAPV